MPDTFLQVPPDSTGKKMRVRSRVVGPDTVHEQAVFMPQAGTWFALADAVAFANNKHHISLMNAAGSGVVVSLKKILQWNLQLAAVTGAVVRMDLKRATAVSGGTAITPQAFDTANGSLPAGVTVATNGTVTEGALLMPTIVQTDETAANANFAAPMLLALTANMLPVGLDTQDLICRPGEGVTLKQITANTVGSYAWLLVFGVEPL